jgi:anti-sigma factor RsiW
VTRAFVEASIAMEDADLFLERARLARERRAARWLRWLDAGVTVLLLLAGVVAGGAFHQNAAQNLPLVHSRRRGGHHSPRFLCRQVTGTTLNMSFRSRRMV